MAITLDGTNGITSSGDLTLNNGNADGAQVTLASSGYSNWNLDNYSGRFRAYYNATEYFTITNTGNMGIGTSSPANRLDSYDSSAKAAILAHGYSVIGANAHNNNGCIQVGASSSANLQLDYDAVTGGTGTASIYNVYSGALRFGTANTERMRIDSNGKVGIGMSPTDPLTIQCSSQTFGGGLGFKLSGGANNWGIVVGGDAKLYLGYSATTTPSAVGNFATNGTYTATSDIRKKKDVTYKFNGLDIVNALKPAQGRMLDDEDTSPLRPMFIAQDMVDVVPALVSNLEPEPSDDPLLGVDYASITPILVKAIQEQQELIKSLTSRIETLEAK